MAIIPPTSEDRAPFVIPSITKECFTFYKIFGDWSSPSGKKPLICLPGGPGGGHELLLPIAYNLWTTEKIPCILYDQIGCASSTHLRDTRGDESFWQTQLWVDEFWNLVSYLKLDQFSILGHSWGGGLASVLASSRPAGLERLIIISGLADAHIINRVMYKLVHELPPHHRDVIIKHDDMPEEYNKEEFSAAMKVFHKRHMYRDDDFPGEYLAMSMANFADDDTSPHTVAGPKLMTNTGSFRDWTVITRLPDIEVPALVIDGEFDYAPCDAFFEGIKKVKYVHVLGASHTCFLESASKDKVMGLIADFLEDEPVESSRRSTADK